MADPDGVRRVRVSDGRAWCEIVEGPSAVIVSAGYRDDMHDPNGHVSLHVVAPDRGTARLWCDAMLGAMRAVIERASG